MIFGRAKPRHLEEALQVACVHWCRLQHPDKVLFAIPNGGKRNAREGARLKKSGVLAGVPDLLLAWGTAGKAGLFLELKVGKNTSTLDQCVVQDRLQRAGYVVAVVRTLEEFIQAVNVYIYQEVR